MQRVANVIVNNSSRSVDKEYDYLLDESITNAEVGMRVIVPFGKGDRQTEGYITGIKQSSRCKELKCVEKIIDDGVVLSADMMDLARWIKTKYMCTYISAIKLLSPPGIAIRFVKRISVVKYDDEVAQTLKRSRIKLDIISVISENNNDIELNTLFQKFTSNIMPHLRTLIDMGVLMQKVCDQSKVNDKYVCMARLNLTDDEAYEELEKIQRKAPTQAKMLQMLIDNEQLPLSDLVNSTNASYTAVAALRKKELICIEDVEVFRYNIGGDSLPKQKIILTSEQKEVLKKIYSEFDNNCSKFLLHGVTGSGKTQVFIELVEKTILEGKKAIVLVPEISITSQMVNRFKRHFDKRVAVYHSGLSLGERYDEWKKIKNGDVDIVVGTRSAIFAPFDNIGVIIIDEEHEQTYKSEISPRYVTVEIALKRAEQSNSLLLLASATPSINSYYKSQIGEYKLLEMKNRYNNMAMPNVMVVDMRKELELGNRSIFSKILYEEIKINLERKEQTILFLNKRGFSSFVSCRNCGFVAKCPNCDISLKFHKNENSLICHYCGYAVENYKECPECKSNYIRYFGGGTQKVEDELQKLFPNATCIRMDVDTTTTKSAHENLLNKFEKENIDILVGTQMISKGLDFANVTLVGAVLADTSLYIDDFRSNERTFSLLEQVTGRCGRANKKGRAIIQTYQPDSEAINAAKEHNYNFFYNTEIQMRKALWYPPFCDIILLQISGDNKNYAMQGSKYLSKLITMLSANLKNASHLQILGPVPSQILKMKNKFRYNILIKCENADDIRDFLIAISNTWYKSKKYKLNLSIDKNPNSMI